jgi:hypothetical protein
MRPWAPLYMVALVLETNLHLTRKLLTLAVVIGGLVAVVVYGLVRGPRK